jgi:hypothetical protein
METFRDHLATVITDNDFDAALRAVRSQRDPKVPEYLYEYEEKEIAYGLNCCDKQYSKSLINIADFFGDLKLESPFCDRLPGIPIWMLLPFYNQVIVWLEPYRSSMAFEKIYGLKPNVFADLCGSKDAPGKIVPILNAPPHAFAGIKHFDRILSLEPPTMWRDFFFQRALIGPEKFSEARKEAREVLPKKLKGRGRFASLRGTNRGSVRDLAISCYSEICSFGGQELARKVVSDTSSSEQMVDLLFYYSLILYDSLVSPLGGNYPCTREQLKTYAEQILKHGNKCLEEFPVEIGKSLISGLKMPLPTDPSSCQWWTSKARDLWKPARKALKDLDMALSQPDATDIQKDSVSLQSIWQSVSKEFKDSRALRKRLSWELTGLGIVGLIGGIALSGFPGLIASIISTTLTLNIFDIQAIYSRLVRPRHLISVIDLHRFMAENPHFSCNINY